jgi:hypothetical protein
MPQAKNAMEIFKHLDRSNCRECGETTCLSFAGAVYQARKELSMCPRIDPGIAEHYSNDSAAVGAIEEIGTQQVENSKRSLAEVSLDKAAARTGGQYDGRKLTVKVLGKTFGVDQQGRFYTDVHVNTWIAGPFLDYVIHGEGMAPTGDWVSFRELGESGEMTYPFFQKRCEAPMKRIADTYTELFDDLVHIFGGRKVDEQFQADISVILHPLPKFPVMICYWKPDDGLESSLNIYFDKHADRNLKSDSILTICTGLALMFEKLSVRHGVFLT